MATGQDFAAQVSAFVAATKARQIAVFRESAERVIEVMQTPVAAGGAMPIDTGFLRASLQITKDAPTPAAKANPGGAHAYTAGMASLVILSAEPGETIYACYGANYAAAVNFGRSGKPGRQFVGLAAQRWTQIVNAVCGELQSRVEGGSSSTPGT